MKAGVRIGVTGHQEREGLDWAWTRASIARVLEDDAPVKVALSSLAVGTDQAFAEVALAQSIDVHAVVPFEDYDRCFRGEGLTNYRALLKDSAQSTVLRRLGTDQEAFLAAGYWIVDHCDILIAVWDGKPADGVGGTADVVAHALSTGRPVIHIDPFGRTVRQLK